MSNFQRWEQKHALPPIVAKVFIVLMLVFGIGLIGWAISAVRSAVASRNWSRTQGVIVESKWVNSSQHGCRCADIRYSYSVNGHSYEGNKLLPGQGEYTENEQEAKVRQYRVGMSVPVFYDPSNPADSCLEPGQVTYLSYLLIALGLLSICGAVAFTWRTAKGRPIPYVGSGSEPPPVIEEYDFLPKK